MKDYLNEIDERFPVRNSAAQKESFRDYVLSEAGASGLSAEVVRDGNGSAVCHNVVIGDPEKARVVFTAHYDTPRRSLIPNMMLPLNPLLRYLYIFVPAFAMAALAIGTAVALLRLTGLHGAEGRLITVGSYMLVYISLFLLVFRGPANRRNRNDNTSGTASVLTLALKLAGNPGAAFILFDCEELGKKGSKAYAKAWPEIRQNRLIVNMDCVGNGSHFIVSASEAAMNDPGFHALSSALERTGAKIYPSRKAGMNSDQKSFDRGVGICACSYRKGVGFYTARIHTRHDTVADSENIRMLTDALAAYATEAETFRP